MTVTLPVTSRARRGLAAVVAVLWLLLMGGGPAQALDGSPDSSDTNDSSAWRTPAPTPTAGGTPAKAKKTKKTKETKAPAKKGKAKKTKKKKAKKPAVPTPTSSPKSVVGGVSTQGPGAQTPTPQSSVLSPDPVQSSAPQGPSQEGPGYGSSAGALSVTWENGGQAAAVPSSVEVVTAGFAVPLSFPGRDGRSGDSSLPSRYEGGNLRISGVGYRANSDVDVRIGSGEDKTVRVDVSGTLDVVIEQAEMGRYTPGLSVIAVGRAPSGTQRTLVGSVPPLPGGQSPTTLLLCGLAVLGLVLRSRTAVQRMAARTAQRPLTAAPGQLGESA